MKNVHLHLYMYLLICFCSFISYQDNATPLYVASQNGDLGVVQTLLEAGADVNISMSTVSLVMFYCY